MDLSYNNALVILAQQSGKGQHSAKAGLLWKTLSFSA
jgi:hypothetical protein